LDVVVVVAAVHLEITFSSSQSHPAITVNSN